MKELTDEELNVAMCEWEGWKDIDSASDQGMRYWRGIPPRGGRRTDLANHITGIEALGNMHEAEKGLTTEQVRKVAEQLTMQRLHEFNPTGDFCIDCVVDAYCASARPRAIALLHVVNPGLFATTSEAVGKTGEKQT